MRKIAFSFLLILSAIGFVSCSEEDDLKMSYIEVENRVASDTKYYTSEPTSVNVYIGHYLSGEGVDLSRPTYVSIKTHASETNGVLSIIDSIGNEVNGNWLLPEIFYTPYMIGYKESSHSIYLKTEFSTKFTIRMPDTETSKYKFDIILYQPDSNTEYVIKDCTLMRIKGVDGADENGNFTYSWTIMVRSDYDYDLG